MILGQVTRLQLTKQAVHFIQLSKRAAHIQVILEPL